MPEPQDADLVLRTRAGDKDAYGDLVARYQGHVYGLAYSLVGDWANAQDIAQETFVRAYTNLDQLRDPARFAAWLRRVTFGVAMNWLKRFQPGLFERLDGQVDLEELEIPDFEPGPAEVAEKRDLAEAVLRAVASLPSKYRVPLTMFHLDGLSYEKVADFLDIPLGTAKSLIHRARRKLRPVLMAYAGEGATWAVQEVFDEHKLPPEFRRNVIEGVGRLEWGGGRENSFVGALAVAMLAMGEDVTYEYLMGASGAAFRLHFHQPEWCPSSPDATVGFDHSRPAMAALGYACRPVNSDADDAQAVRRAREAVVSSIDQGRPVIALDLRESVDWGAIVGYEEGGKQFLCRTYYENADDYAPAENWPWSMCIIGEKHSPPDRKERILKSFEIAVEMAETETFGEYASGFGAYGKWAADLLDDARFDTADGESLTGLTHTNAWCYVSLLHARIVAAAYLRSIGDEFGGEAAVHLAEAADLYERVVQELRAGLAYAPFPPSAPFPGRLREGQCWTREMRHAEAAVLSDACALERKAVHELKAALSAAGKVRSPAA